MFFLGEWLTEVALAANVDHERSTTTCKIGTWQPDSHIGDTSIHTQDTALANGGSPVPVGVKSSNSGSIRGNSLSGSGTVSPVSSRNITGIGSPQ